MITIEKKVTISKSDTSIIADLLREPQNEAEWVGDGTLYLYTVMFDDGYFMDIMICGVTYYEEGGCNSAWTQAVLYSPQGAEINCSDVEEDFFGFWALDYNDKTYVAIIEEEE